MVTFFQVTWFLWWTVAIVVIARWCWIAFFQDQPTSKNNWKGLYRSALLETDPAKMGPAIREAEAAILLALGARLFRPQDVDRVELQDALSNLQARRETAGRPAPRNILRAQSDLYSS